MQPTLQRLHSGLRWERKSTCSCQSTTENIGLEYSRPRDFLFMCWSSCFSAESTILCEVLTCAPSHQECYSASSEQACKLSHCWVYNISNGLPRDTSDAAYAVLVSIVFRSSKMIFTVYRLLTYQTSRAEDELCGSGLFKSHEAK